jgi:hypothetical protein
VRCDVDIHANRTQLLLYRIIPSSAHAAFDKAGAYLKIKVRQVRVDPVTRKVPIKRVARAMSVGIYAIVTFTRLTVLSQKRQHDNGEFASRLTRVPLMNNIMFW